ncbi:hypothetical protein LOZ57_006863 [Ophidiomyces ophidiicola]|uniref:uncharacterized protein n=1 Tax=Ophidiomyces ophidiicola TaxID=1387563 RepID=UPI0020C39B87|nr:uncharacterized protein LOZ57_006863 [Ophidiomyces ophidiicola]KAI1935874.1 hypothetical protein LOZ57_006863 [Ophidiomyces ophidiicola]KAI2042651.1 hypothetical protein LOZ43_006766 [Ophidiomyces ophidiicola]
MEYRDDHLDPSAKIFVVAVDGIDLNQLQERGLFGEVNDLEKRRDGYKPKMDTVFETVKRLIEQKVKLTGKRPHFHSHAGRPSSLLCIGMMFQCLFNPHHWVNNELIEVTSSRMTYQSTDSTTPYRNTAKTPSTLSFSKTRAVAAGVTKGWNIGGKIGGSGMGASLEVSAGYSNTKTKTTTDTKSVSYTMTCPPAHECTLRTLTFTAHLKGKCRREAKRYCLGQRDACARGVDSYCTGGIQAFCPGGREPRVADCQVSFPVVDGRNKLVSTTVAVQIPLKK